MEAGRVLDRGAEDGPLTGGQGDVGGGEDGEVGGGNVGKSKTQRAAAWQMVQPQDGAIVRGRHLCLDGADVHVRAGEARVGALVGGERGGGGIKAAVDGSGAEHWRHGQGGAAVVAEGCEERIDAGEIVRAIKWAEDVRNIGGDVSGDDRVREERRAEKILKNAAAAPGGIAAGCAVNKRIGAIIIVDAAAVVAIGGRIGEESAIVECERAAVPNSAAVVVRGGVGGERGVVEHDYSVIVVDAAARTVPGDCAG